MRGARRALAVTSPAMSTLVKTGGCAAVQPRAPARQVKANRGGLGRGEGREGAMRSRKARSGGRRMGREVARRVREVAAWEATTGWGKERRTEAASWVAVGRGTGRESRWRKKAATAAFEVAEAAWTGLAEWRTQDGEGGIGGAARELARLSAPTSLESRRPPGRRCGCTTISRGGGGGGGAQGRGRA
jgi:hypothetical protein